MMTESARNAWAEDRALDLPADERELFEAFRRAGMGAAAALEATNGRDRLRLDAVSEQAERDRQAESSATALSGDARSLFDRARRQGLSPGEAVTFAEGRQVSDEPRTVAEAMVQAQGEASAARREPTFDEWRVLRGEVDLERERDRQADGGQVGDRDWYLAEMAEHFERLGHDSAEARRLAEERNAEVEQRARRPQSRGGTPLRESAASAEVWRLARFDEAENRRLRELVQGGASIPDAIRQVESEREETR